MYIHYSIVLDIRFNLLWLVGLINRTQQFRGEGAHGNFNYDTVLSHVQGVETSTWEGSHLINMNLSTVIHISCVRI